MKYKILKPLIASLLAITIIFVQNPYVFAGLADGARNEGASRPAPQPQAPSGGGGFVNGGGGGGSGGSNKGSTSKPAASPKPSAKPKASTPPDAPKTTPSAPKKPAKTTRHVTIV